MKYPKPIQDLVSIFQNIPTVGPKTAERYVFYLLKQPSGKLQEFAECLSKLKKNIIICSKCLAISEINPCPICSDKNRNIHILCITANAKDMLTIEETKQYNGQYHVLGGLIDVINNIKPENLNIKQLLTRIQKNNFSEIILALNPTIEGETTCMYLSKLLKNTNIKITRLAKGLPSGANIEYADGMTLSSAFKHRTNL